MGIKQTVRCGWAAALAAAALAAGAPAAEVEHEFKDGKWVPVVRPAEGTPAGELAAVRQYLDAGKERKAVRAVEKFLDDHPDGPAREEAMMLAGQAEMNRKHYYQAFEWYERQISEFPNGRWMARALDREYEIAEAFLSGAKRIVLGFLRLPAADEGLEILSRIAEHDPGSVLARRALMRIGDYHYDRGAWDDAVDGYDHYVEVYAAADPSQTAYAMARAARAIYSSFKGLEYDETPLLEADQRFREFSKKYPLAAEKENVAAILKDIYETRAAKALGTAKFYRRTGRPRAAELYFRRVVDEFPNAACVAEARGALGAPAGGAGGEGAAGPATRPAAPSADQPGGASTAPGGGAEGPAPRRAEGAAKP